MNIHAEIYKIQLAGFVLADGMYMVSRITTLHWATSTGGSFLGEADVPPAITSCLLFFLPKQFINSKQPKSKHRQLSTKTSVSAFSTGIPQCSN